MKKRIISLLLSAIMLFSLLPTTVFAEETYKINLSVYFYPNEDTAPSDANAVYIPTAKTQLYGHTKTVRFRHLLRPRRRTPAVIGGGGFTSPDAAARP